MSSCQSRPADGAACASSAPRTVPIGAEVLPVNGDPIRISDSVVEKVAAMLADEGDPALALRIFVTGGGCSGFQYGFAFDDAAKDDDLRIAHGPITVLIDAMSLQYLNGAEIDYEDNLEGARFVIRNPNAASTCGCGSSFSV
ncbi:MAG TPA: iron-sulfur cluster insertion protein ErpA [Burkholderiaceae bacterium]|nr:iron-sulfur cluster insertion protein ErpA [Burkholderiaceae bacterium]